MAEIKVEFRPDPVKGVVPEYKGVETVLDELCITDGAVSIHVEMMSDRVCWMGIDLSDGRHIRSMWSIEEVTKRNGKRKMVLHFRSEDEG